MTTKTAEAVACYACELEVSEIDDNGLCEPCVDADTCYRCYGEGAGVDSICDDCLYNLYEQQQEDDHRDRW